MNKSPGISDTRRRKMTLPLEGFLVLDLSQRLPGSLCTQILADLGADVIKIENPGGGDGFRWTPPLIKTYGSFFHVLNRNKRGMTLDVKQPMGRTVFMKLASRADVLLESFRPGWMKEIGLGYEDLKTSNPRLIYCSLTGFGQDGPRRDRPAHDIDFLAASGILGLIGEKGGRPSLPAVQFAGAGGGLSAALGILAALLGREKNGGGEYLDVAILDGLNPFLGLVMSQYMTDAQLPERGETLVGGGYAFYNVYETRDGKFIVLGCLEEKFWETFCKIIHREELIGEQFAAAPRRQEIIEELRLLFLGKTRDEWLEHLGGHEICFTPVNSLEEALKDPQIEKRGLWFKGFHPTDGEIPQQSFPVKFSGRRPGWRSHPPGLGEHTKAILREFGLSEGEISELEAHDII
jgi:crotonobetainyl-CoA:carnitine CoA-transferase CaiB-like acyl-CoA transferase